eukprot:scaffold6050_cov76-Alexandrium_tamarense.AAC.1
MRFSRLHSPLTSSPNQPPVPFSLTQQNEQGISSPFTILIRAHGTITNGLIGHKAQKAALGFLHHQTMATAAPTIVQIQRHSRCRR